MSKILIEKLRKTRQRSVPCGKHTIIIRRPTNLDMLKLRGVADQEMLFRRFVVDWENVTGLDIYGGGTADPVAFDTDLFVEWIADRPDYWEPIVNAIVDAYKQHEQQQVEQAKNS